jgi:hypothetical protein
MDTMEISGAMHNKWCRRRQYLINPPFQWKYAIWIMLDIFAVCSVLALLLLGIVERSVRWRALHPDSSHTAETALIIFGFAVGFGLVAAGGFGLWSVVITHRFCGPLLVVGSCLSELAAGRLPNLRPLRRKDEFKDFYALFRGTINSLRQAKSAELNTLTRMAQVIQSASRADDKARRDACDFVAERIEQLRRQAASALGDRIDVGPDELPGDADQPLACSGACAGPPA